jgi:phosphoribosylanthranilate isomerase
VAARALFVKVCGITTLADARAAVDAGADALGFVFFARSLRAVTPAAAAAISQALPRPRPLRVGVFVNAPPGAIAAIDAQVGLDAIQLAGDEDPEYVAAIGPKAMKVLRITGPASLAAARGYRCQAFVLEGPAAAPGGSGGAFDWRLARDAKGVARIVLGGGLTPDNVAAAVAAARPFGVDVTAGVESAPGVKDPERLRRFIAAARAAAGAGTR